ncbi:MAG: hypothetical protein IJ668_05620 [Selenomonadaceae bacterium]|nr:hypothetical protein [Selenomonadaceae bacterium]
MREIKFQGRAKYGNRIVGDLVHGERGLAIRPFGDYTMPFGYKVDEETVGQFTGFIDSEGQELFEGDMVTPIENSGIGKPEGEYLIEWDDPEGGWLLIDRYNKILEVLNEDTAKAITAIENPRWR